MLIQKKTSLVLKKFIYRFKKRIPTVVYIENKNLRYLFLSHGYTDEGGRFGASFVQAYLQGSSGKVNEKQNLRVSSTTNI